MKENQYKKISNLLGFSSKLYAIPWDAAKARIHEYALIVGSSKEEFESAATFESWAEFGNSDYEKHVRAYYGEETGDKGVHPGKMESGMSGSKKHWKIDQKQKFTVNPKPGKTGMRTVGSSNIRSINISSLLYHRSPTEARY